jgi:predicted DNA-binding transcriptional regulator AlpA
VSEPLNSAQIVLADGIAERVVATLLKTVAKAVLNDPPAIVHNAGPPAVDDEKQLDNEVLTIPQFCARYRLSRATLYGLWQAGEGPKFFKVGTSVRITGNSARAWLRQREQRAAQADGQPTAA